MISKKNDLDLKINKYKCRFSEEELINKLTAFVDNAKIIKDENSNKINDMDLTFIQLKRDEEEKLIQYFLSKKAEYTEIILNYLLDNMLSKNKNKKSKPNNILKIQENIISQLIELEKGYDIYEKRLKNEIKKIGENEDEFNIKYLTIMLLGKSGVGKSTLINQFLKLKEKKAKTGTGKYQTILTEIYTSKSVPFLRLVDTRGIELNKGFGAKEVKEEAERFIKLQLNNGNMNNFVHCFWYCITGARFEQAEIDLLKDLRNSYKDNNIPIIFVYTQATDDELINEMKKYIEEKKLGGHFIQVLAKRKKIKKADLEPFNLDLLLKETLNKCKKALEGEMNSIMTSNISSHLKNLIRAENEKISKFVKEKITIDFIENYELSSDKLFKNCIFDKIIGTIIANFLNKNIMSKSCSSFLKESQINEQYNQYIQFYKEEYNNIIKNDLSTLAYDFLDQQAIKEKETSKNILNHNRRTHKDFIETTKNFLDNNFSYISQILYIKNLIDQNYFIGDLKEYLKSMTNNILDKNDIKKLISDCFLKKFKQFEDEVKNKTPELMNKDIDINSNKIDINEKENKDSSSPKDNKTKNSVEGDLPPANGAQDYPNESQIKKNSELFEVVVTQENIENNDVMREENIGRIFPNEKGEGNNIELHENSRDSDF